MRSWLFIIIAFAYQTVLLSCAHTAPPANQQNLPGHPPAEAFSKPLKVVGNQKAFYSPVLDETEVAVILDPAGDGTGPERGDGLSMMVNFRVKGKTITQPTWMRLGFFSYSRAMKYKDNHELKLLLDGAQLLSGDTRVMRSELDTRGFAQEALMSPPIPYSQFLQMLNARTVEVQLGSTRFALKGEHVEALRDLQRIVEQ